MENSQGLRNFVRNIQPIMMKCKHGENLTKGEQAEILEFYLETIHVLSVNPEIK